MNRTSAVVVVVIIAVLLFVGYEWRNSDLFSRLVGSTPQGQLIATVKYQCDQGKTLQASLYNGPAAPAPQPGQPPTPTGTATVVLSDGRTMNLNQTLSADGVRYSNGDPQKQQGQAGAETFVFWSKGNGALVLENNQQKSFIGCIKVADNTSGSLSNVYESGQQGFSIRYPSGYTVDSAYVYQNLGPGKDIHGIKFTIDPSIATGTNLSTDSYISVEQLASTTSCTADKFLDMGNGGRATTLTDGTNSYSYASTTGAGAGNRYEEQVFALSGTNPCIAVRYYIHYGAIENYPAGVVQQFSHGELVSQFDAIRNTLIVNQ